MIELMIELERETHQILRHMHHMQHAQGHVQHAHGELLHQLADSVAKLLPQAPPELAAAIASSHDAHAKLKDALAAQLPDPPSPAVPPAA